MTNAAGRGKVGYNNNSVAGISDGLMPKQAARESPFVRVRELRLAKGLTLAELAGRVGISSSYMQKVEAGQRRLNVELLFRLSQALDADPADLMKPQTGQGGKQRSSKGQQTFSRTLPVSRDILLSPPDNDANEATETFPVSEDVWGAGRYLFKAHDNAMYPSIHPGDLVLVEYAERLEPADAAGRICAVKYNGESMVRRIITGRSGNLHETALKADNPTFPPLTVNGEDDFAIKGICLEVIRRRLL